jgi:signal transduction histidine kinase
MRSKRFYVFLGFIPFLTGLVGFFALLQSPYLGISFQSYNGAWHIQGLAADSPVQNLKDRIGDEVVSIGELAVGRYSLLKAWNKLVPEAEFNQWAAAQKYLSGHVRPGVPVTLTLRGRDGLLTHSTVIPASSPPVRVLKAVGSHFIAAFVYLLIALFIAFKKPGDVRGRLFYLITFCMSMVICTFIPWSHRDIAFDIRLFSLLISAEGLFLAYLPVFFFHFMLVFPSERNSGPGKMLLFLLYSIPVPVLVLSRSTGALFVRFNGFLLAEFGFFFLAAIVRLIFNYVTMRSPEERAQIKWVFWATLVYCSIILILADVPMLAKRKLLVGSDAELILFILIPLSMAFSIMKYRLMDIDTLLDNTIIYSLTLGVLVLIDAGVISAFARLRVIDFDRGVDFFPVAVLVWTVIFAYVPLRKQMKLFVKRLLKREIYNINESSLKISTTLLSSTTPGDIIAQAEAVIRDTLHPRDITTILFDAGRSWNEKNGWKGLASEQLKDLRIPAAINSFLSAPSLPVDCSAGVVVPLIASRGSLGCMLLKNKHSDRLYSSEDLKLLRTVSSQAALALENVSAWDQARKQEEASREEKERIAREIHDGIALEFAGILANSEKGRRQVVDGISGEEVSELLMKIEDSSRRGIQELRNIIWAVGPEYETARFLLPYIKRYASDLLSTKGIGLKVLHEGLGDGMALPPKLRHVLMRVVQEACHNIMKHSSATRARMHFRARDGRMEIEIEDNGKGFDVRDEGPGNGIRNMRRRVSEAGGEIEIASGPGNGARIRMSVPL